MNELLTTIGWSAAWFAAIIGAALIIESAVKLVKFLEGEEDGLR